MKIWNFFTGEFTGMETSEEFDELREGMKEVEDGNQY